MFLEQGIGATSMEQIAESVPVSKMTIYNYFTNKEGLVEAVVDQIIDDGYRLFRSVLDSAGDPLEALTLFYKNRDAFGMSVTDTFVYDLRDSYPQLLAKLFAFNEQHIKSEFEALILKGQQMGQIRRDISPHILMMYITFMKEFAAKSDVMKGAGLLAGVGEQLMTILYHGIIHPDYKPR